MKINLPSVSLCCMSRFYLWPLTYLKATAWPAGHGELPIETQPSCGHRDNIGVTRGSHV